jgi:hypothetical protein
MMHLEYLLPILIFLIWIISTLIRNAQEEQQNTRPTRSSEGPRTPGRSQTEIDRFLEEVNRRRRLAAERRGSEATPIQIQPAVALERPQVLVPRPPVVRPATPKPIPVRTTPYRGKAESIVIAEIVEAEPVKSQVTVAPTSIRPSVGTIPIATSRETGPAAPSPGGLPAILGSADGLGAAWLLREILGPPRCRRNGL